MSKMSARQLCRQTQLPSKALFYFSDEGKTGIAPTRIIIEKDAVEVEVCSLHFVLTGYRILFKAHWHAVKFQRSLSVVSPARAAGKLFPVKN